MEAAAWFTVIVAAGIIAILALGLVRVILHLTAVTRSLQTLLGGVEVVAAKTSTVPTVLTSVNENLRPVREFTDSV
jgi:hypothetical protein